MYVRVDEEKKKGEFELISRQLIMQIEYSRYVRNIWPW